MNEAVEVTNSGWLWVRAVLRVALSVAVLLALFFRLPMDTQLDARPIIELAIGLVVLVLLIWWQVRSILGSALPGMRAIEALAFTIPLLLVCFASTYYLMARDSSGAFTESLTRIDALYFTMAVFSTVGFGDISAHSQSARLVVTAQIAIDLLVLGLGLRVILGAVQLARQRQTTPTNEQSPPA